MSAFFELSVHDSWLRLRGTFTGAVLLLFLSMLAFAVPSEGFFVQTTSLWPTDSTTAGTPSSKLDDKSVMNNCTTPKLDDGVPSNSETLGVQSHYDAGLTEAYFTGVVDIEASDSSDLIIVADQQDEVFIYSFILEEGSGFEVSSATTTGIAYPDGAVTWLEGDFTGSGLSDLIAIAETGSNSDRLELTLFVAQTDGYTTSLNQSLQFVSGAETIQWLVGDFDGDDIADFVHLFSVGVSALGWTTYQLNGLVFEELSDQLIDFDTRGDPHAVKGNFLSTSDRDFCLLQTATSSNLQYTVFSGQGNGDFSRRETISLELTGLSNVVALAGDFTGDGFTDLAQPYNSNGVATLAILRPSDPQNPLFAENWLTGTEFAQTTYWFAGNVAEDSELQGLVQVVNSSGQLELVVYAATGIASAPFAQIGDTTFEDIGYQALAWLSGVVAGENLLGLFQVTTDGSNLEVNTYQIDADAYELYDQSSIVLLPEATRESED